MNVIQQNNKLFIDGKEVKQPKSVFFKNCVCTVNNKMYVNGLKVTSVDKTFEGNKLIGLGKNFGFSKFDNDYKITSIVTKEQMEQMAYKVDE